MSIERIRGGWTKVPEHLKTRTMLAQLGFKPGGEAVAEVWGGHQWYQLFDEKSAIPKRKFSDKQRAASLESLEIARAKSVAERTCSQCSEVWGKKEIRKQPDGKLICKRCIDYLHREAVYERRVHEGMERFRSWFATDFVILDTESTDLDGEIVEIGIVDRQGNTIFHSLIKPIRPVADDSPATRIHGITNAELEDAPVWADIRNDVRAVLCGKLVLAYNAEFDSKMVANSCSRNGVPLLDGIEWDCVMEAYRLRCGEERWISLANASGRSTAHRAIADCLSTLAVIERQWVDQGLIVTS
ncbi:3'-5' exonuclease [Cohnella soli]|uniref:3'-5' exonuclease n=1 Tax=Cohnella soli TaxID=425005 RepID=A0ABW0HMN2_9BACL